MTLENLTRNNRPKCEQRQIILGLLISNELSKHLFVVRICLYNSTKFEIDRVIDKLGMITCTQRLFGRPNVRDLKLKQHLLLVLNCVPPSRPRAESQS